MPPFEAPTRLPYNPSDWYWIVAGSTTQVYSSKAGDYVLSLDTGYQDWLTAGGAPTRIASEAELGEVLAARMLRPVAAGVLDGYRETHATSTVSAVAFKVIFNHENRLRAIERSLGLNGSPADLTAAQAKNAIKVLM